MSKCEEIITYTEKGKKELQKLLKFLIDTNIKADLLKMEGISLDKEGNIKIEKVI